MKKRWNNATDIWEYHYLPGDESEVLSGGFPDGAADWLRDPSAALVTELPHLVMFPAVALVLASLADAGDVRLVGVQREHAETVGAFLVGFGCETKRADRRLPLFIQLGIEAPDWACLEGRGFSFSDRFRHFVETFAGAKLGMLDAPPVLTAPPLWNRVRDFFGETSYGHVFVPKALEGQLDDYLVIQLNYYGIITLLSKSGQLWLAHSSGHEAAPANVSLDEWVDAELSGRRQPNRIG